MMIMILADNEDEGDTWGGDDYYEEGNDDMLGWWWWRWYLLMVMMMMAIHDGSDYECNDDTCWLLYMTKVMMLKHDRRDHDYKDTLWWWLWWWWYMLLMMMLMIHDVGDANCHDDKGWLFYKTGDSLTISIEERGKEWTTLTLSIILTKLPLLNLTNILVLTFKILLSAFTTRFLRLK